MGMFNLSFPRTTYVQATAPTGANAGARWWDTDDLKLYYYNGSSWIEVSSSSDAQGWESNISQIMLEILRLSAEGTLTAPNYDSMFCDYFSDADGQDGTIDTGNTTGVFDTDAYDNGYLSAVEQEVSLNEGWTANGSQTAYTGCKITTGSAAITLNSVTKYASSSCTDVYIGTTIRGSETGTASFSGNTATFGSPLTLAANTDYFITFGSGGSAYNAYYMSSGDDTTPTGFTWEGRVDQSSPTAGGTGCDNGISVNYDMPGSTKVVQTNAQALSFEPAYIQLHSKDITLSGGGTFNYDVSFDGGSTWDSTANALDTKIEVTDGSSKSMVIQLNLIGTGTQSASMKDYEVILWSS